MTNEERVRNMSKWDLAEFLYDVSNGATVFTNCTENCKECEYTDGYCISEIAEWLMGDYDERKAKGVSSL